MIVEKALTDVGGLYTQNLREHGLTSKSVGWKDEASQLLRFAKLGLLIERDSKNTNQGITVNDLGCGYGAMFKYLDNLPGFRLDRYFGYDISSTMLEAAAEHIKDPRAELINGTNLTRMADYSFVSGTFNVRMDASDEVWTEYIKSMIANLAAHSSKGFAFNLLSTYVDWKQGNLYYGDPLFFFDYCKRNVSRYVTLVHDYPLYEWTMIVRMGGETK